MKRFTTVIIICAVLVSMLLVNASAAYSDTAFYSSFEWEDVTVLPDDGFEWEDVTVLPDDGFEWEDVTILPDDSFEWEDVTILPDDGFEWEHIK